MSRRQLLNLSGVLWMVVLFVGVRSNDLDAADKDSLDELNETVDSEILKQLNPIKSSRVLRTTYYLSRIESDWVTARQHCQDHRLRLLSIEDLEEDAEITAFLNDERVLRVWTSGNDLDRNGHYTWSSTRRPMVYTNWHRLGVPRDPRRNCVFTATDKYWGDGTYGWDEEHCVNRLKFICEESF